VVEDGLASATTVLSKAVQVAQAAANAAQTTADEAVGAGTVSDSATDPAVDVAADGLWVAGPQVDLTSVAAGTLTLTGTGPQQDDNVLLATSPGTTFGEFRVVEIEGMTETTLFTGTFKAVLSPSVPNAGITNLSSEDVADFSAARTSTGAISYRLDVRQTTGPAILDLSLYIFARRAA
jgi:hypothetical protein